jgi:hypothetical protein
MISMVCMGRPALRSCENSSPYLNAATSSKGQIVIVFMAAVRAIMFRSRLWLHSIPATISASTGNMQKVQDRIRVLALFIPWWSVNMHTTKSIQGLGVVIHFTDVSMRDICRIHPIKTWDTYQTPNVGDRFASGWIAWIDDRDTIDIKVVSIVPRSNVHRHRPDSVISFGHRDALASPRNIGSRQLNFLCVGGQDPKGRLGVFNLGRTDLGPPLKLSLCAWKG